MDFDSEKITRIHSNLIFNALKFTPSGGQIYLQMSKKETSPDTSSFILNVKDTGIGIPENDIDQIFDRFYQVDDSSTRAAEGTGIGLTLVSELVKAMKGNISAKSELSKGTTFSVELPITNIAPQKEVQHHNQASQYAAITQSPSPDVEGRSLIKTTDLPTALVIEDNPDVIYYLISCLEKEFQIEIAMNGEEGIQKAVDQIPDIIVSDVMMPIKDGFEVCQTLKTDERTSHIPIILLTAKADFDSKMEGLQRGADAYLSKPFQKEELLLTLHNRLRFRKVIQSKLLQFDSPSLSDIDIEIPTEVGSIDLDLEAENQFLNKIRSIVEKDLSDSTLDMPRLQQKLKMSRSQIYKKVKALTGKSPSIYIRLIRLHHAQNLLQSSDLNVSEVAYEVGFSSPVYFSDIFYEEFGIRPNETRK